MTPQSMWAAHNGTVIFFEVHPRHAHHLKPHWDTYHLTHRLAAPQHTTWGPLERLVDYRR